MKLTSDTSHEALLNPFVGECYRKSVQTDWETLKLMKDFVMNGFRAAMSRFACIVRCTGVIAPMFLCGTATAQNAATSIEQMIERG